MILKVNFVYILRLVLLSLKWCVIIEGKMHGGIELLSLPGKMLMLEIEVPTDIIMRVVFSFPPFRTMLLNFFYLCGTCNSALPFRLSSCPNRVCQAIILECIILNLRKRICG